ncbi:MAG TPA: class I SAM-dependent methyltransferase [Candidatus Acidoferrum sp.]|nr:class I SAM-dependent methyltransferase [Candidatus Acidoferrum sp.]
MATTSTAGQPTPERIFNTLNAYQQTAALRTAIELDVFSAIGEGANTAAAVAAKTGAAERGVRSLCDYLTVQGFLTKEQGKYALTQESAIFLDRKSPACLASMAGFLGTPQSRSNFDSLTQAVRRGGSVWPEGGDNSKPNDDFWVAFAKSMAPLTRPSSEFITGLMRAEEGRPMKVLDIAAGHGMYGITVARKNPKAEVVALDWPAVLQVAQENARKFGVAERYSVRAGSAFETEMGSGYDYVLLTNIFHHFDIATCEKLMRRVHAALTPGGKAITLEFVPDEDRVNPPTAAAFSLLMLANTDAGDAYTFAEYDKMFRNAGFAKSSLHPVPQMPQKVVISEKSA